MPLFALALLAACDRAEPPIGRALPMVWVRTDDPAAEGAMGWEEARAGLWWALSLMGAQPADEGAVTVVDEGEDRVLYTLDLEAAGFSDGALEALDPVSAALLASDEATVFGGLDTGRWLMATLYSPWRYYAVTGACDTLEGWRATRLIEDPARFAVTDSLLVPGDREIELNPDPATWDGFAWRAAEGEGSLEDGSFAAGELEVLDLMENGQQRFAVYGVDGALQPSSSLTTAGPPGRCMWCHEGNMQIISAGNADVPGYLTLEQFKLQLLASQDLMEAVRAASPSPVRWSDPEVHALGERLVEDFLSPSAGRLAREWGVSEALARSALDGLGLETHLSEEYPELPPLYTRAELDAALPSLLPLLAPQSDLDLPLEGAADYRAVDVLSSSRELSPEQWEGLDGADGGVSLVNCAP